MHTIIYIYIYISNLNYNISHVIYNQFKKKFNLYMLKLSQKKKNIYIYIFISNLNNNISHVIYNQFKKKFDLLKKIKRRNWTYAIDKNTTKKVKLGIKQL